MPYDSTCMLKSRWEFSDNHDIYPINYRRANLRLTSSEGGGELVIQTHEAMSTGDRRYMEDVTLVDLQRRGPEDRYCHSQKASIFAVFDGHGGSSAADFARENLWKLIRNECDFWSDDPQKTCEAIRRGFRKTHEKMWEVRTQWPSRSRGLSTSGTTASVVILKMPWVFTAHVGDSGILLGEASGGFAGPVSSVKLTRDHKPDHPAERSRIEATGGKVMLRKGVHRVVWTRPSKLLLNTSRQSDDGSGQPSTEEIPFLAMSRALGDLWSYNKEMQEYSVSPEPDVDHFVLCPHQHKFLILGSDGLWNMMKEQQVLELVKEYEIRNPKKVLQSANEILCGFALEKWRMYGLRADNITSLMVSFTATEKSPASCCTASAKSLASYRQLQQPSVLTPITTQNNMLPSQKRKAGALQHPGCVTSVHDPAQPKRRRKVVPAAFSPRRLRPRLLRSDPVTLPPKRQRKAVPAAFSPRKLRPRLRSSVRIQSHNQAAAKGSSISLLSGKMAGSSYNIIHCRSILL